MLALMLLLAVPAQGVFEKDTLRILATGGQGGEGPAWHPKKGIFASGKGGITLLGLDGKPGIFAEDAGTNGLLLDRQGNLLACQPGKRRVVRFGPDGKEAAVLADSFGGKKFNQPNDLALDSKNRLYFSDPRYGPRDDMQQLDAEGKTIEGVYRIDPDGKLERVLGREVERANGVLVSADDRYLFVADNNNDTVGGARKLWRFELTADGTVRPGTGKVLKDWFTGRGPDGLKQDEKGRLFVAGGLNRPNPPAEPAKDIPAGIYVVDPDTGKQLDFLPIPTDEVTNCAFAGADRKTLLITGGGVLYSVRVKEPGRVIWP
ncbi:MAG: SMP-30/gluconolactonase/LRE family protein [Gemmataceae bacterium]|nr:SMP-30/gluconolactonase/LRE family protein [Gemmataceae bacterium]